MSGLTEEELDKIKTRANTILDNSRNHETITVQLAADILMLLLDKKVKET
jgi:hypothetical protein